ncbi:ABC transporter ATP-binding protein [Aerococcaceae bacterium INB8]|uniref:ABC transporter ATP-binding protein n=1 Tax=Ruoffia halotolerans TaxID=2748684 RepID=A0A839A337_9LACT|nr:ABC transporter ATP-binding protein [Ruoffia halotolerans]MBA5728270.1 ABC transporter ATP-binding protein [Ruoffia halotolerans]
MENTNKSSSSILNRLFSDLSGHKLLVVLSLISTVIQVGLTVYLPILIGQAVNQTIGEGQVNFDVLLQTLMNMGIVIGLNAIVQWVNPILFNKITYEVIESLRNRVLEKVHSLSLNFIDQRSTGDLVSRVTTDTEQLGDGLIMIFNQFFIGILTIFITIFTMAQLDLTMMLLVVVLTPISLFISRFIAKKSYSLFRQQTKARGEQADFIEENIQQADIVRLFNSQEEATEIFTKLNADYSEKSKWAIFYSSTINPGTRFINALIYAALTFLGAVRIVNGTFTVGELTTFLNYANQYTKPFNDISNVLAEIQSALACADRLYTIIDQSEEVETGHRLIDSSNVDGKVNFNRASFSYTKDKELITDLTLSVKAGDTVAIVGPTGAGKSTLINLLMRFYDLDQGQILIDNEPITDFTRESVRKQFGMVLQETWLKGGTIHDNIAYGHPTASRAEVVKAAKAAHAHRFIELLPDGYDTILTSGGAGLSTGQQQLLSIARIFVSIPTMLILDEATSSIDTRTEILIQEAFDRLMRGRTSFIIAHRLSTIMNADMILVMKDGSIVEQGNHDTLMKARGLYYTMQSSRSPEQ